MRNTLIGCLHAADWKAWVFALMFHFCLTPVYSFSLFSPTLGRLPLSISSLITSS